MLPCRKTVLVVRYLMQSLCPHLLDSAGSQASAVILDSVVRPVSEWVAKVVQPPGKYTALVWMENVFFIKHELQKLQLPQVDASVDFLNLAYEEVSEKYIEEQFTYHYANLLKEEQRCKDREAIKRLYEKHFPTKKSITSGVEKMVKRCTKHLSADTSETLLPMCK